MSEMHDAMLGWVEKWEGGTMQATVRHWLECLKREYEDREATSDADRERTVHDFLEWCTANRYHPSSRVVPTWTLQRSVTDGPATST